MNIQHLVIFFKDACNFFGNVISDWNVLMREKMRKFWGRLERDVGLWSFLTRVVAELRSDVCVVLCRSALVE